MSNRPSSSSASELKSAISSLKEVHSSAHILNEDIRELVEQVEIVENLPASTNLARIDGWRSKLLTKMRMNMSDKERQYRDLVDIRWTDYLRTLGKDGPAMFNVSYSFENDLQLVQSFFSEAHQVASKNVLFISNIRTALPVLPYNVDAAISRLLSDIKTLDIL